MTALVKPLPGTVRDPLYPDSDAEAVGETDFHFVARLLLYEALQDYFARWDTVYVASDMFWYWEEGNPSANRSPDVLVAKGVGKHARRSFRSWEEQARPCVLFEMASERTWREDVGAKRDLYAQLGVSEYFIFDPETVYLDPIFQGFRLQNGVYVPLLSANDGSLNSVELGLRFTVEGTMLRVRDLRTGRRVLTRSEKAQRAERRAKESERRAKETERRAKQVERLARRVQQQADELAAEVARLKAKLPPEGE